VNFLGGKAPVVIIVAAAALAAAALFWVGVNKPKAPAATADPDLLRSGYDPTKGVAVPTTPASSPVVSMIPAEAPSVVAPAVPDDKEAIFTAIHEAAITYDAGSLSLISPHLSSSDAEVRAAAVDGIMLLGDAAGAPLLRKAADQARNAAEEADLRAKADYLELPPAKLLGEGQIQALRARRAGLLATTNSTTPLPPLPGPAPALRQQPRLP